MKYVLLVGALALGGCTATSTCASIDAAHQAFLGEVAASPGEFSEDEIRNERRAYLAASIACGAFVAKSPTAQ